MNDKLMEKLAIEHPELKWYIDIVKINEDFEQYQSGGLDKFVKTMQDDEKDLDEFIKTIPENFWELASDRLKNDSYFIQQVEEIVGEEIFGCIAEFEGVEPEDILNKSLYFSSLAKIIILSTSSSVQQDRVISALSPVSLLI